MMKNKSKFIVNLIMKAKESYHVNLIFLTSRSKNKETLNDINKRKDLHNLTFKEIDCLECGNCCTTTPAIVISQDIQRISKHLGLSKKQFKRKYLINDLTGDTVINNVPCTFLQDDLLCSIYEVRPEACRRYPHTDESTFNNRPKWNAKNTIICPATYKIIMKLQNKN